MWWVQGQMSLKEALKRGLEIVPTCKALCYVDFRSGLVLGKASRRVVPQEEFDRMADSAARLFCRDAGLTRLSASGAGLDQFAVLGRAALHVFARAMDEPDHALCYHCGLWGDMSSIPDAVRAHRESVAQSFSDT